MSGVSRKRLKEGSPGCRRPARSECEIRDPATNDQIDPCAIRRHDPIREFEVDSGSQTRGYLIHDVPVENSGGADGNQTHDLFIANEALYQLSYCPKNQGHDQTPTRSGVNIIFGRVFRLSLAERRRTAVPRSAGQHDPSPQGWDAMIAGPSTNFGFWSPLKIDLLGIQVEKASFAF